MSLSKQLYDDMSRRDHELPVYGEDSEPWRQFEDVYGIAWPDREHLESESDEEC